MPNDQMGGIYGRLVDYLRMAREATDPVPQTGSVGGDMLAGLPIAMLGMRPSGVSYSSSPRPTLRSQGRFVSQNGPFPNHPATTLAPAIGAADVMANVYNNMEDQNPAGKGVAGTGGPSGGSMFADRFGSMAPPSAGQMQDPLFLQGGLSNVPAQFADRWKIMSPKEQIALMLAGSR